MSHNTKNATERRQGKELPVWLIVSGIIVPLVLVVAFTTPHILGTTDPRAVMMTFVTIAMLGFGTYMTLGTICVAAFQLFQKIVRKPTTSGSADTAEQHTKNVIEQYQQL